MQAYLPILKNSQLFSGVSDDEILSMLSCLGARMKIFEKGDVIFHEGEYVSDILVMLKGEAHVQSIDYWGNRTILNRVAQGDMFLEAYCTPDAGALKLDVVAAQKSVVAFFDVRRVITTCSAACRFHAMVVQNLVFALSEKNRKLVAKLMHMSGRTTRAKLISYLSEEAKKHASGEFTIPFNRQQLADYLSVDRSAMSLELCKMRDSGMLEFEKNRFKLLLHSENQ
ncbi:MAG: Crp/Fnr family transcriptional regulator [Clostridia bacterium]|nr:Crp/Fnr family transcriptional regulator [Clostridiales bacterium]MBQ3231416.1 Crp/Fnr family transcriptional regulator [Clostridia bacterium]